MGILYRLTTLVRQNDRQQMVYECGRCGTSLDTGAEQCPYCGPTTIREIEIQ